MTLTEVKTRYVHYFRNKDGQYHGLYQGWYVNGTICWQAQFNRGLKHGEFKYFDQDGTMRSHRWYAHDKKVLDFLKGDEYPTTPEAILNFKLTYQGKFIPK